MFLRVQVQGITRLLIILYPINSKLQINTSLMFWWVSLLKNGEWAQTSVPAAIIRCFQDYLIMHGLTTQKQPFCLNVVPAVLHGDRVLWHLSSDVLITISKKPTWPPSQCVRMVLQTLPKENVGVTSHQCLP